jgi:hypothetical protein
VKESGIAGETACATTSSAVFPKVGQAVSPADLSRAPIPLQLLSRMSLDLTIADRCNADPFFLLARYLFIHYS